MMNAEQRTMKARKPYPSRLERTLKRRDKQRRNWCRRCPFRAPSGKCLDTRIRSGRCGDWVYYLLPGGKQCRRRWVRPSDPRTTVQGQNRVRFGAASHKYSAALTEQERDAWVAAGARRQSRPRLSQSGPLTGQQYYVQRKNAASVSAKAQCTKISSKVPKPQRVTRPTSGTHRGITGMPPGQQGRRWRVTGTGWKVAAISEVLQQQKVERFSWRGYPSGSVLAPVPRHRGTGSARPLRARLRQRMGVRLMPARRPTARPCALPARGPGARFGGGNWCPRQQSRCRRAVPGPFGRGARRP
jgi:hypothetical protein